MSANHRLSYMHYYHDNDGCHVYLEYRFKPFITGGFHPGYISLVLENAEFNDGLITQETKEKIEARIMHETGYKELFLPDASVPQQSGESILPEPETETKNQEKENQNG